MRWERLFADLEAQAAAEERATWEIDVADLVRAEVGGLMLVDRLRAHVGAPLAWTFADGQGRAADLVELGADWVLLRSRPGEVLVPLGAVSSVAGLGRSAVVAERPRGLRLTTVLRGLARDRQAVRVDLRGGTVLTGTVDRVGADHLDLAVHPLDEPRRPGAVVEVRIVPTPAVLRIDVPG